MSAQVDVLGWVDAATCPMAEAGCDGDGYPTYPRGDKEQCQWCYERKHVSAAVASLIAERAALRGLIEELLDTELAELACAGSMAPVEDVLGRMQAALASAQGVQS